MRGSTQPLTTRDRKLGALALENAADDTAITIDPAFDPGTGTYTAVVPSGVDKVTVEATAHEPRASVGYFGTRTTIVERLADADGDKDGHQVALWGGNADNTLFNVKVTAWDRTSRRYHVAVRRVDSATVPDLVLTYKGRMEGGGAGAAILATSARNAVERHGHMRQPFSGVETVSRCVGRNYTLRGADGLPKPNVAWSLEKKFRIDGLLYPGHDKFTIGTDGQLRTIVGVDYPFSGEYGFMYLTVRATDLDSGSSLTSDFAVVLLHPQGYATDADRGNYCANPGLTVADAEAVEGPGATLDFTVSLRPAASRRVKVAYATADGTATAPADYAETSGTLTFAPGETQKRVRVPVVDDAEEDGGETLTLTLSSPTGGAVLGDREATGTIYNDEDEMSGPQPLTASFGSGPESHDGSDSFELQVSFTEALAPGGASIAVGEALSATGGTVSRVRRVNGRRDLFSMQVKPSGNDAVTVTLAPDTSDCAQANALCTPDGRALAEPVSAEVQGPPGLSVADAEVDEAAENAALVFEVTLDRAASGAVTVAYATSDGTAVAPGDYEATSGTLTFETGETEKTVSVPVHADAENEESETMTLTLSNPTGAYLDDATAIGTIHNTGPIPGAWLARFGRTVADQVIDAVDMRLRAGWAPGVEATLAGQHLSFAAPHDTETLDRFEAEERSEALAAWLRGEEEERDALSQTRTPTERELFTGTTFTLTGGSAEGGTVSAWGRGAISRFDAREDELTLDGEVGNLMLGADFVRGRATAGLVLSHARGSGGYRGASAGDIEASLTGLYPYGRYEASERLSVWGVGGYAQGTLTVAPENQAAMETDMDLAMASVGVRGVLLQAPPEGGAELALKSDAMAVRTTSEAVSGDTGNLAASEADVTRLRLGVEGSRAFHFQGAANLVPSVELGVRHDGGDAETGFGVDIGAGLAWSDPARGLSADMHARGLLTHEDGSFSERGFAGALVWDPSPGSARGPSLSLARTVGAQASGGVEALLSPQALETAHDAGAARERRNLEAKVDYGFGLFEGGWTGTPQIRLGLTDSSRETVLGWRLAEDRRKGLAFGLDVEAGMNENDAGEAGHRLGLGLGWRLLGAEREALELRFEGSRLERNDTEHRVGVTLRAQW